MTDATIAITDEAQRGRLTARPGAAAPEAAPQPGVHALGVVEDGDALLYVPQNRDASRPAPLVIALHGARGNAYQAIGWMRDEADEHGIVLLAPESRLSTWDIIHDGWGPDVAVIDAALARAFALVRVDPARLGIAGFSDGASYALSLGLANGDLFADVLAFSPGFSSPPSIEGPPPRIYISHGRADRVLKIDITSRRIVPRLTRAGYDVAWREFDGGHSIPGSAMHEAMSRVAAGRPH